MHYLNLRKIFSTFGIVTLTALLIPKLVFATHGGIQDIIIEFAEILSLLGPVIVALALLYFFWGMSQFILHAGDEARRSEGRQVMVWGIIALFVIISVWGLVAVLNNTFVGRGFTPQAPGLPTIDSGIGF